MCDWSPILTLLVLVIIYLSTVQCQIGEACKTELGSNGFCINIADCPPNLRDAKNNKFPKPCGYSGTTPFVCCKSRPGLKSKQKCEEYKRSKSLLGRVHIVGGTRTLIKEFPHMVALGYEDEGRTSWNCGGSLISEQHVLTAAHCAHSRLGPVKFARLGTVNLQNPEEGGEPQDFRISQIIMHPSYKIPSKYNDIALLKLDSKAIFNLHVRPACLQAEFQISHSNYIVTGWGFLEAGGESSNELMKVDIVPYSYEVCRKTYANDAKRTLPNGILEESQVCAGGAAGKERDTCNGDSGGPLQIKLDGSYYVVGITSFGKQCGLPNIPAVYTRVSKYISWIENIVWPSA